MLSTVLSHHCPSKLPAGAGCGVCLVIHGACTWASPAPNTVVGAGSGDGWKGPAQWSLCFRGGPGSEQKNKMNRLVAGDNAGKCTGWWVGTRQWRKGSEGQGGEAQRGGGAAA